MSVRAKFFITNISITPSSGGSVELRPVLVSFAPDDGRAFAFFEKIVRDVNDKTRKYPEVYLTIEDLGDEE